MSVNRDDLGYVSDMLVHARLALRASAGMNRDELSEVDDRTGLIERRIEIVGEAARRVSAPFQSAHPQVPWQQIIRTRHRIAHEYAGIDYDVIWRILTSHLPALIGQLESILPPPPADPET